MGFLEPAPDKATMGCDYIFDLRPVANARANGIKNGGGAEETMYYGERTVRVTLVVRVLLYH